jgi:ornithine cyclodeaminase/alanine dehydrogenase-like protein (mu-crystallin family)
MEPAMLYLTESDVLRFLPMRDCIGLMRTAFERLASGEAINQPRRRLHLPTKSTLHYMAGGDGRYFGAKIYATNPGHGAYFLFLLYRAEDAAPLAMIEANHLGQIRTGAASALATQLLGRPDSRRLAIIGSGFQACTQLEAMLAVLPFERVLVWSRSEEKRQAFAHKYAGRFNAEVEAAPSAEEAVRNADVIVTATNAAEPVLEDYWVAPGTHVNAMGSNQARRRELPPELVERAGLIVADNVEQSRMESGDLLLALTEAGWQRVVELKDVVAGRAARSKPDEITLFKSNGLAVEDVIAAGAVYERAVAAGAGVELPFQRR